jgi:hypothetical protein
MKENSSRFTEDETFRILARPSFEKIWEMHNEWKNSKKLPYPATDNVVFMKHHGWSWLEFLREQKARGLSPF